MLRNWCCYETKNMSQIFRIVSILENYYFPKLISLFRRCENGIVESQYKCKCRIGFKYDSNTTTCLPDCGDDCKYGVCEAPGKCRCFNQYEQKDTTCVPICAKYKFH